MIPWLFFILWLLSLVLFTWGWKRLVDFEPPRKSFGNVANPFHTKNVSKTGG